MNIKQELASLAEPKYRDFSKRLLPGTENIIGVRLPQLHKLAKRILKEDWEKYLKNAKEDSFEEILLEGFVIGHASETKNIMELLPYIRVFIGKIDNWSVCDSFCCSLKGIKKNESEFFDFLEPYFCSDQEFEVRFAIVTGLNYYLSDSYRAAFLESMSKITVQDYYVRMAIAWAISYVYLLDEKQARMYMEQYMDAELQKKTLQKIIESNKVTKEEKQKLRSEKQDLQNKEISFDFKRIAGAKYYNT